MSDDEIFDDDYPEVIYENPSDYHAPKGYVSAPLMDTDPREWGIGGIQEFDRAFLDSQGKCTPPPKINKEARSSDATHKCECGEYRGSYRCDITNVWRCSDCDGRSCRLM